MASSFLSTLYPSGALVGDCKCSVIPFDSGLKRPTLPSTSGALRLTLRMNG